MKNEIQNKFKKASDLTQRLCKFQRKHMLRTSQVINIFNTVVPPCSLSYHE